MFSYTRCPHPHPLENPEVALDVDVETAVALAAVPVAEPARTRRRSGALEMLLRCTRRTRSLRTVCCRVPVTKLGRLVKDGKIKSIEEIYLFSLPVKEYQIIDILLPALKGAFPCAPSSFCCSS